MTPSPSGPRRGAPSRGVRPPELPLLKRVFEIDLEHCPHCGGPLTIIAAIEHPSVIAKILTHVGLPARALIRSIPNGLIAARDPLPPGSRP